MYHIAVDLGGSKSQICVRNSDGEILAERKVKTSSVASCLPSPARVILETCAEAFHVADQIRDRDGLEPVIVPAVLAPQLGVGQRGVKTDIRDGRALSEMSCRMENLPSVHVPTLTSRDRKSMIGARDSLVKCRTALINSVRGWMRTHLLKPRSGTSETFPKRARTACLERPEGLPMYIEHQLAVIEDLNARIKELYKEITRVAAADEVAARLQDIPGVGPITALAFRACIDKVERFDKASAVASYLGLTPGERSSSERVRRLGINKAGAARVRVALVQASWVLWRTQPNDPNVLWAKQIAQRRGNQKAIVALARKLSRIMFAMWRDATTYIPPTPPVEE